MREIGAEIAEDVDPQREELAVLVERHFGGRHVVAALRVADEMLGAVADPGDRFAEAPGGLQHQRIFAVDNSSWCQSRRRRPW